MMHHPVIASLTATMAALALILGCGTSGAAPVPGPMPLGPSPEVREFLTRAVPPRQRRAVVIGINTYGAKHWKQKAAPAGRAPNAFSDLDGAVADAKAMVEILAQRFQFERSSILQLTNTAATRSAILEAIERYLIEPAQAGDNLVFYYSGHGSEVENPGEEAGKDETIVPADTVVGAYDIRDKELAQLWNRALARGANLTVIMDSCHSGGLSRGSGKKKSLVASKDQPMPDIKLASLPEQSERAMFLAAATSFQDAEETRVLPARGAFTLALERALADDPNQTTESIFTRVRAELKSERYGQDPVLSGKRIRSTNLVGEVASVTPTVFAFLSFAQSGADQVELQGGTALGLTVGSRLQLWLGGKRDGSIELEVTKTDLARSTAKVEKGARSAIKAGTNFVVSKLAQTENPLRVHVPTDGPSALEQTSIIEELQKLGAMPGIKLIDDPIATPAHAFVYFEGGNWSMKFADRRDAVPLGRKLTADIIASAFSKGFSEIPSGEHSPTRIFVAVPPSRELGTKISQQLKEDGACKLTNLGDSQYTLVGRPLNGAFSWYWVLSNFVANEVELLPSLTDARSGTDAQLMYELDSLLDRLIRIHDWVKLRSGAGTSGVEFPYTIGFRDVSAPGGFISSELKSGHEYSLVLTPTKSSITSLHRYVYVLNIDANGAGTLVFPGKGNGDEGLTCPPNGECLPQFPQRTSYLSRADAILKMCTPGVNEGCVLGRELFFFIVSNEQLTNLEALNWDAVIRRGVPKSGGSPLENLLMDRGRRGPVKGDAVPTTWSIQRMDLKSVN